MAKSTGAQVHGKAKELKPARLLAFKLWQENPQITAAELDQALKEKGFEVLINTRTTWLSRFKKRGPAIRTYKGRQHPAIKSKPARLLAFKLWQENPQITAAELIQALKEKGFQVHKSTYYLWLKSFRGGKVVGTYEEKPATAMKPSEITLEPSEITLEQIIKAAGSVETLSVLFYQGVMRELARKDAVYHILKQECITKDNKISSLRSELDKVTRERNRIMREYNEKLARVKVGTLTLDETAKRLISKL